MDEKSKKLRALVDKLQPVSTATDTIGAAAQQAATYGSGAYIVKPGTITSIPGTITSIPATTPGAWITPDNTASITNVPPSQPDPVKMYWAFLKGTSVVSIEAEIRPFGDVFSMTLVNGRKIVLRRIEDLSELVAVICGFKEGSYLLEMEDMADWLLLERSLR